MWYLSQVELSTFLINFPSLFSEPVCDIWDIWEIWARGAQVRLNYADAELSLAVLNDVWSVGLNVEKLT